MNYQFKIRSGQHLKIIKTVFLTSLLIRPSLSKSYKLKTHLIRSSIVPLVMIDKAPIKSLKYILFSLLSEKHLKLCESSFANRIAPNKCFENFTLFPNGKNCEYITDNVSSVK